MLTVYINAQCTATRYVDLTTEEIQKQEQEIKDSSTGLAIATGICSAIFLGPLALVPAFLVKKAVQQCSRPDTRKLKNVNENSKIVFKLPPNELNNIILESVKQGKSTGEIKLDTYPDSIVDYFLDNFKEPYFEYKCGSEQFVENSETIISIGWTYEDESHSFLSGCVEKIKSIYSSYSWIPNIDENKTLSLKGVSDKKSIDICISIQNPINKTGNIFALFSPIGYTISLENKIISIELIEELFHKS